MKCFNYDNLMRKYSGKPVHEKLFETEAYTCKVKDLTLSFGEIEREKVLLVQGVEEMGENMKGSQPSQQKREKIKPFIVFLLHASQ